VNIKRPFYALDILLSQKLTQFLRYSKVELLHGVKGTHVGAYPEDSLNLCTFTR